MVFGWTSLGDTWCLGGQVWEIRGVWVGKSRKVSPHCNDVLRSSRMLPECWDF